MRVNILRCQQRLLDNNTQIFNKVRDFFEPTINTIDNYIEYFAPPFYYALKLCLAQFFILYSPIIIELAIYGLLFLKLLDKLGIYIDHYPKMKLLSQFLFFFILAGVANSPVYTASLLLNKLYPFYQPYIFITFTSTCYTLIPFIKLYLLVKLPTFLSKLIFFTTKALVQFFTLAISYSFQFYETSFIWSQAIISPISTLFIFLQLDTLLYYNYLSFKQLSLIPWYTYFLPFLAYIIPIVLTKICPSTSPLSYYLLNEIDTRHPFFDMQPVFTAINLYCVSIGIPTIITSISILVLSLILYDYILENFNPHFYSYERLICLFLISLSIISFQANITTIAVNPIAAIPLIMIATAFTFSSYSPYLIQEIGKILCLNLFFVPFYFQSVSTASLLLPIYYFGIPIVNAAFLYTKKYYPEKLPFIFDHLFIFISTITSLSHFIKISAEGIISASKRMSFHPIHHYYQSHQEELTQIEQFFYPTDKTPQPTPHYSRIMTGKIKALYDFKSHSFPYIYTLAQNDCLTFNVLGIPYFTLGDYPNNSNTCLQILNEYILNETNIEDDRYPKILLFRELLLTKGLLPAISAGDTLALQTLEYPDGQPIRKRLAKYLSLRIKRNSIKNKFTNFILCFNRFTKNDDNFSHWEPNLFKYAYHLAVKPEIPKMSAMIEHFNPLTALQKEQSLRQQNPYFNHGQWTIPDEVETALANDFLQFKRELLDRHTYRREFRSFSSNTQK